MHGVTTKQRRLGVLPAASLLTGALLAGVFLASPAAAAQAPALLAAPVAAAVPAATKTVLQLKQLKPMVYLAPWHATGSLTAAGKTTAGRAVVLYRKNYRDSHGSVVIWDVVGRGTTDAHGRFSILAPGLDYSGTLFQVRFTGSAGLGASTSAAVAQTIAAEKVAISANAAYGRRTAITVTVTSIDGKAPRRGYSTDNQILDVQYFNARLGWISVDNELDQYGNFPQANTAGKLTIAGQPSTTAVSYRAQLQYSPADGGGRNTMSGQLAVAATRPTTAISAAAVLKGQAGYVPGKFTFWGQVTSQSAAVVTHSQTVQIFRQKIGTTTWVLAGTVNTDTRGMWRLTVPTDLTMTYQARLHDSPAIRGSISASVRVIKT